MINSYYKEVIEIGCIAISVIIGGYVIGRLFAKGLLKEFDMFLGKKFTEYINNKNKKKDDNETQE